MTYNTTIWDWDLIHKEYIAGSTKSELCKKYSVSKMTIYRNFVKLGLKLKTPKESATKNERHWNWKGGHFKKLKILYQILRTTQEYKKWRKEVFIRDNFSCIQCASKIKIQAHHKIKLRTILKDIETIEEAMQLKLLWAISNGETLCLKCHQTLHKGDKGDMSQKHVGIENADTTIKEGDKIELQDGVIIKG